MKIKFDPALDYQNDAIQAVTGVFDGQALVQSNFEISATAGSGVLLTELGVGNQITLSDEELLANVQKIQTANNIEATNVLQGRDFSVEMETGTGKTYVYLRSIFELSKKYGFKKFIIVVPSVAIREGVLKSIEITRDHFLTLYDNEPFDYFVYDSKKLGRVRQFATSNQIQIMVINIQSFSKDIADKDLAEMTEQELKKLNIINRENDKMSGRKPIDFIQAVNPVVIIDEPQSVDNTPKAKRAIANLNPVTTLRYSATHRNFYNLLYKLDPVRAYDLRLVKRIEVASIRSDGRFNDAYVKLLKTDNKNGIKARVEIHKKRGGVVKTAKMWVKQGDDLFSKSGELESYSQGYIIQNIDCTPDAEYIEFNSGKFLDLGVEMGGLGDEIMKAQVYEIVEQHLKKERTLHTKGIKVLSLFFIDRVANYRIYNEDGTTGLGKIGKWFEEAYKALTAKNGYEDFAPKALGHDIARIHNGYFSRDKAGQWKDSTERGSKDDDDTYRLIMRHKERLLDPKEPLRFIFSHSALREGWDNPNVFQICSLNETAGIEKKRQEIGRGLRLPVNALGERVHDEGINRLTVVASESYEDFAKSLQNEFEEDFGIHFGRIEKTCFAKITRDKDGEEKAIGQDESISIWNNLLESGYINEVGEIQNNFEPKNQHFELEIDGRHEDIKSAVIDEMQRYNFQNRVVNARDRKILQFNTDMQDNFDFKKLWDKIKHRTRYRVEFDTNELIEHAVERIKNLDEIEPVHIAMTRVNVDISAAGVSADSKLEERRRETESSTVLPDLLAYLQKETELTRHTLVEILKKSERLEEFKKNPQQFMAAIAREISRALHGLMLEGIKYEKIANHYWEMSRIKQDAEEGIVRYLNNLYEVKHQGKSLFDAIEFDSEVERKFAKDLDTNENVRLFVKFPGWFKIDTPIGPYNPDWAFVTERDKRLYFVSETKGTKDSEDRRLKENQKIICGKSHFKTIDVNYKVVTRLSEVKF